MIVTIFAYGTRGDVQPYFALAIALKKAGHTVRMPVEKLYKKDIEENGLDYLESTAGSFQDLFRRPAIEKAIASKNRLKIITTFYKEVKSFAKDYFDELCRVSPGSDLLISSPYGFGVDDIAEKLGVHFIYTAFGPLCPTTQFPCLLGPNFPDVGFLNRFSHKMVQQLLWQMVRPFISKWRKKTLGLKGSPFLGPYKKIYRGPAPVLFEYSPSFIPRPLEWPKNVHVTGFWRIDDQEGWQPPKELVEFINSGSKPIFIGFGSLKDNSRERITKVILEALEITGQRCVLGAGWNNIGSGEQLPSNIFKVDYVPHFWLFKQMAVIVHHGGAGTTGEALRAGVPSIVTPAVGDGFFWSRMVYKAGVSPKPISYQNLTAENLAGLIKEALNDKNMQTRARELGSQIQAENGTQCAIRILEDFYSKYEGEKNTEKRILL